MKKAVIVFAALFCCAAVFAQSGDVRPPSDGLYYMIGDLAVPYVKYSESAEELNAPYVRRTEPAPSFRHGGGGGGGSTTDSYAASGSQPRGQSSGSKLGGMSIGTGLLFTTDGGGGIYGMSSYLDDEKQVWTTPWYGIGFPYFLDLVYVELGISLNLCYGTDQYEYDGRKEKDKDTEHSFVIMGFSALFKYPIGRGGSVSVYPAAGIEYALVVSGKTTAPNEYGWGEDEWEWDGKDGNDKASDFSALWFKFGAGLDIALAERVFWRTEALYGVRLPSKYEKDDAKYSGDDPVLGHGITIRAGVGFNF